MKEEPPNVFTDESRSRASAEEPDDVLVARCRGGDLSAFELLFRRHHPRVFRTAVAILRDRERALDAVQETFVRAHRSLDRYSAGGSFAGWLLRITANLAVDGIRRRRRENDVEVRADAEVDAVAAAHSPDEHAEATELRRALDRALGKLSPMQRVVVVMKEVEGLSCEEIARALRCSVGTVMSRLHYGRAKMQRFLRDWRTAR
jgi:RNA polymerase sigma-70 factor, ECF subfamily